MTRPERRSGRSWSEKDQRNITTQISLQNNSGSINFETCN